VEEYTDDANLFKHIINDTDVNILQAGILKLQVWLDKWLLKRNVVNVKLYLMDIILTLNDYFLHSEGPISVLGHLNYIKNLGVTFDSDLKCNPHIDEKVNKAYSVLGLLYRNF